MMKTGFGDTSGEYEEQFVNTAIGLLLPVLESAIVLAGQYAKACGRDAILSKDMEYAIKYCATYKVGEKIGSHFPDIYDDLDDDDEDEDEDEEDEDDIETIDESDETFERYSGDDEVFLKMNEAYDNWDNWIPTNPTEEMLKNAINSNGLI